MKRAVIKNNMSAVKETLAHPTVSVEVETKPTPFFVSEIKNTIKNYNFSNDIDKQILNKLGFKSADHFHKTMRRSLQILNAFIKKRSLSTVESGDINNRLFVRSLHLAIQFMRDNAENVYNKEFDDWVSKNVHDLRGNMPVITMDQMVVVL